MKRRLLYISFAAALAIFAGCAKDDADAGAGGQTGLRSLELSLGSMTKAVDAADPTMSGIAERVGAGHRLTVGLGGQSAVYKYENGKFVPDGTQLVFPGYGKSSLTLALAPTVAAVQDGTKEGLFAADDLEFSDGVDPQENITGIQLKHANSLVQFEFASTVAIDNGSTVKVGQGTAYNIPSTGKYQAIIEPGIDLFRIVFTAAGQEYVADVLNSAAAGGRFEPNTRYTFSVSIDETDVVLKLMLIEPWAEAGVGSGSEASLTRFTVHGLEADMEQYATINYVSGFSTTMTRKSDKEFEVIGPQNDIVKSISFGDAGPEISVGRLSGETIEMQVDPTTLKINGMIRDEEKNADRINTIGDLKFIGETFFWREAVLMHDLYFDGTVWTPIFGPNAPFLGDLDGNGKSLHNLVINSANDIGLFASCSAGSIKDLTIASGKIGGNTATRVGAFAAKATNFRFINCKNYAEIIGVGFVGGIVGVALDETEITDCANYADVSCGAMYGGGITGGTDYETIIKGCVNRGETWGAVLTGGIAGLNNGLIKDCRNEAVIVGLSDGSSTSNTGGIVGRNYDGTVVNCINTADLTGTGTTGGIIGSNVGSVYACVNSGAILDRYRWTGGIVGSNYYIVAGCYNTGKVESGGYVGGLVGESRIVPGETPEDPDKMIGSLKGCYSTGSVILTLGSDLQGTAGAIAAGIIEKSEVVDCYYAASSLPAVASYTSSATSTYYEFSATQWPADKPASFWGIGNDYTQGKVWSDLGSYNATNPKYPELSWKAASSGVAPRNAAAPAAKRSLGTIEKYMEHCDKIAADIERIR